MTRGVITSRKHPLVTRLRALARERQPDTVLLDGPHLVVEARDAGLPFELVAVAASSVREGGEAARVAQTIARSAEIVQVSDDVLAAMSPVRTPSGIVAIARAAPRALAEVFQGLQPLVVAALDVQDPGNLGAMVRAAEAGGATGFIACGDTADPLGWKALRGAMGSAFRVPLAVEARPDEVRAALAAAGLTEVATVAAGGSPMDEIDLCRPVLVWMGREGSGLPPAVIRRADTRLAIPMEPPVASLNVAVATALVVYEARRQRRLKVRRGP